jgi:transcriptional regulator with XRE-family HTH domain
MADTVPLADTPLAHWINRAMAAWEDPDTGMLSISQKQLCARTGISTASLYQILKQGHTPKPEVLLTLAAFFNVSPMPLFRMAYLTEEEEANVDPTVQAQMTRLEHIVERLPMGAQAHFMEALLGQAQMLAAAVRRWEGQSGHNRSAVGSIPGWS